MSAQQRYLTLVQHISKIYAADDGGIEELTAGLKDILTRINPAAATDWRKVQVDSKRLLRVWHSRADDDDAAADEVVDQIAESLKEFSAGGEVQHVASPPPVALVEKPVLEVSEVAPVYKTVTVTAAEEESDEEEEEEDTPVVVVVKKNEPDHDGDIKMLIEEEDEEEEEEEETMDLEDGGGVAMDEDEEFAEAVAEAEAELEEDADAAESVVEESKVADEENKAAESEEVIEPADEAEESDEEEEEEAEEEEGLEVEKRVIRGRPYWVDVNTNKLYAVIGDDDVGDEVGAIINGKPVFRS